MARPLGERAMTAAERQRKRRERLRQEQADSKPSEQAQPIAAPPNVPRSPQPPQSEQDRQHRPQSVGRRAGHTPQPAPEDVKPLYAQARHVVDNLRTCSDLLREAGQPVSALPVPAMTVLQKAAAGKRVDPDLLERVLSAAAALDRQLAFEVLKRFPAPA